MEVHVSVAKSLGAALLLIAGTTPAVPASAQTRAASAPDLHVEGHWVRKDVGGAGSFGGLADQIPPAQLTAEAAAGRAAGAGRGGGPGRAAGPAPSGRPNPVGVPYIVVERPCANAGRGNGALLINPDSGGIHVIEHKDEVILAGERGGVRRIYLDGRPHPNLAGRVPTLAGHSTGRYEGNALIVDTIGLTPGNVQGGGMRTPETHLRERIEAAADGKTMTITYTWDDAKIYQKPHTYAYVFDRLPVGSYAFEDWCDAGDPIEKQSIVPPPQKP
jgi:hypothetical protein